MFRYLVWVNPYGTYIIILFFIKVLILNIVNGRNDYIIFSNVTVSEHFYICSNSLAMYGIWKMYDFTCILIYIFQFKISFVQNICVVKPAIFRASISILDNVGILFCYPTTFGAFDWKYHLSISFILNCVAFS